MCVAVAFTLLLAAAPWLDGGLKEQSVKASLTVMFGAMGASAGFGIYQLNRMIGVLKAGIAISRESLAKATSWMRIYLFAFVGMFAVAVLGDLVGLTTGVLADDFPDEARALIFLLSFGSVSLAVGPSYSAYAAIWDEAESSLAELPQPSAPAEVEPAETSDPSTPQNQQDPPE